ncbi:cytochrome P450 oxidoreductase [Fusarium albosuccineum]|uniref:Choline monooxygenase, chloroplastic n=1 Tax=Fusarium albosuccineum TaxID=1237068 RepID=A0A8H4LMZ3_9HYPO|nr:cytochrome P450 oxidoreductase [Fusarium albosuccineum]
MALRSRFSPNAKFDALNFADSNLKSPDFYGNNARRLVMLKIADGDVSIQSLQALCLLAFLNVLSADLPLAGLNTAFVKNATHYLALKHQSQEMSRLFWSISLLDTFYGPPTLVPCLDDICSPRFSTLQGRPTSMACPLLPKESYGTQEATLPDIWPHCVRFCSLWADVRLYISRCIEGLAEAPWQPTSDYTAICSRFLDLEIAFPTSLSYNTVKFADRSTQEVQNNRAEWLPWLRSQVTYHTIQLIRTAREKGFQLADPFFAQAAAIAGSLHLYWVRGSDGELKKAASANLEICKTLIAEMASHWPVCEAIERALNQFINLLSPPNQQDDSEDITVAAKTSLMWIILDITAPQFPSFSGDREGGNSYLTTEHDDREYTALDDSDIQTPTTDIRESTAHYASPPEWVSRTRGGNSPGDTRMDMSSTHHEDLTSSLHGFLSDHQGNLGGIDLSWGPWESAMRLGDNSMASLDWWDFARLAFLVVPAPFRRSFRSPDRDLDQPTDSFIIVLRSAAEYAIYNLYCGVMVDIRSLNLNYKLNRNRPFEYLLAMILTPMPPPNVSLISAITAVAAIAALVVKYLWSALSAKDSTSIAQTDTTARALPSSWYRSKELYELERRAIFSKRWILVTHKLRFPESGSWVRFEEAGFQFILVRNNEGKINGFHNICRHRAFPVVTKETGQSSVLACKYHGWSYGLNGQLAKAPGYMDMKDFDKKNNGLFPVHVHVDAKGFAWVNLDASKKPEVAWSDDFNKIDQMSRHELFDFEDYHFDHTWEMSGDYNWKTLADNYNECYHCKTAHPDAGDVADLAAYKVDPKGGNIEHFANTNEKQAAEGLTIVSNYYFPNACMTVSPHFFYMMRCVPTSESHCSMEYEVYRHKNASDEDFNRIDQMFKRILGEDKWLCNNAQKNPNAGVFVNGEMHPRMEQGPLYFQNRVRQLLKSHHKLEEAAKKEIWPAQQALPRDASGTEQDMGFCSGLACGKDEGALAWRRTGNIPRTAISLGAT